MKLTALKLFLFAAVFAAIPSWAIKPVYTDQPAAKPSRVAKIRSVVMKISTGDIRELLPHKSSGQRPIRLKGVDPRLLIVDNWGGQPVPVIFDNGASVKPNSLSRGAILGLKIGGGILAGLGMLLGGLGGIMD